MNELTPKGLEKALSQPSVSNVVVQVVHIKTSNPDTNGTKRHVLVISDGTTAVRALTSTQHAQLIDNGTISINTIIRVINSKTVKASALLLTNIEVIKSYPSRIGNPTYLLNSDGKSDNLPNQPPQQPYQPPQQPYQPPQQSYQPPQPSYQSPQKPAYQPPTSMYQPPPQQSYQAAPAGGSNFTIDYSKYKQIPISAIHPYLDRSWFIRARVTSKSGIRTFNSSRGEGKLFSIDLLDKDSSEIRISFFSETVDLFYNYIEVGKVYEMGNFRVGFAKRPYNTLNNEYELQAHRSSIISLVGEDNTIQAQHYKFMSIKEIATVEPKKTVDILAIVIAHEPVTTFQTRRGVEMNRKQLTIMDSSNTTINFTLFGQNALITDDRLINHPVIAIKSAVVSDFGGHSLSGFDSTTFVLNPDIPQAMQLRQWFDSRSGAENMVSLSTATVTGTGGDPLKRKTLSAIKEEQLGYQEKPDFITVKAMIRSIPHERTVYYTACPNPAGPDGRKCQKKVIQDNNGQWSCAACNKSFPTPAYRYILNLEITDHTDSQFISMFNEDAEKLLGVSAEELNNLNTTNAEEYEKVFKNALFKEYIFTLRVKMEQMGGMEPRVRCSVQRAIPVDENKEIDNLITIIESMSM